MFRFFAILLTALFLSGAAIAADRDQDPRYDKLFDLWFELESECRGTPGADPFTGVCKHRDQLVQAIVALDFCWKTDIEGWITGPTDNPLDPICK